MSANKLYYGDNLDILCHHIPTASVDLVYLDPPFNSNRDYNVLFKEKSGKESPAQIEAFTDTWVWDLSAKRTYNDLLRDAPANVAKTVAALKDFVGDNDMMAYLVMMAARLVELHRVLKPTGSLYLHCDPTASHYLKIVLDAVFGTVNFLSDVTWKRTGTHSSAKRWGPVHDVLLVYAKDQGFQTWNRPYRPFTDDHLKRHYRMQGGDGRSFDLGELTAPGTRNGRSGAIWRGFDVTGIGRHWMTTVENREVMADEGKIHFPKDGGWPRLIRYQDESKGSAIGDVWDDIPPINMKAKERLG
ncbi:MAG: DNA methyltransferase [Thermomicrobiales bacterium]